MRSGNKDSPSQSLHCYLFSKSDEKDEFNPYYAVYDNGCPINIPLCLLAICTLIKSPF